MTRTSPIQKSDALRGEFERSWKRLVDTCQALHHGEPYTDAAIDALRAEVVRATDKLLDACAVLVDEDDNRELCDVHDLVDMMVDAARRNDARHPIPPTSLESYGKWSGSLFIHAPKQAAE